MSEDGDIHAAIAAHQAGRRDEARAGYQALLERAPQHADALHFMGLLMFEDGDAAGVDLIRASLAVHPDNPGAHNNLGGALGKLGDREGALASYRTALEYNPGHLDTLTNLGTLLHDEDRSAEALEIFERALQINPRSEPLRRKRAAALLALNRQDDAAEALADIVAETRGALPEAVWYASVLAGLGRREMAAEVLGKRIAECPEDPVARHQLDALKGAAPARAPDAYVRAHFDAFADTFDIMLGKLGYAAPGFVAALVHRFAGKRVLPEIVDLGCGTGLCGALVRDACRHLSGVDLSQGMLERARAGGQYDELIDADLTGYLEGRAGDGIAMAISADTLCYFGDLAAVFSAVSGALSDTGVLIATVEDLGHDGAEDHTVLASGRFAHSQRYLRRSAKAAGLAVLHLEQFVLRTELGRPVQGLVFALQRVAE